MKLNEVRPAHGAVRPAWRRGPPAKNGTPARNALRPALFETPASGSHSSPGAMPMCACHSPNCFVVISPP